jgi:ribosomal protein S18 acetylase RimI-like enzyme
MVWVAEQDAQVVGVMTVETGKNINILSLAVVPTARRRGVASALIGDLKRFAKLRQKMIVMEVPDWSLDVHQFLRSCGFRANRIMDNYFGSNGDAYQFVFRGGKIR